MWKGEPTDDDKNLDEFPGTEDNKTTHVLTDFSFYLYNNVMLILSIEEQAMLNKYSLLRIPANSINHGYTLKTSWC